MSGFEWLCLIGVAFFLIHQWEQHKEAKAHDAALREQWAREDAEEDWDRERDRWFDRGRRP